MNRRPQVPPVIPHVRVVVDDIGASFTVDGKPWQREPDASSEPIGRDQVPDAIYALVRELDVPCRVTLHDGDRLYTDYVVPARFETQQPTRPEHSAAPAGATDASHTFTPGEPVDVAIVIARTRADDTGGLTLALPPAVRQRASLVILRGTESSATVILDAPGANATPGRGIDPDARGRTTSSTARATTKPTRSRASRPADRIEGP